MGIVIKQSIKNTTATYFGFVIGAINTLFLYTEFLTDEYFGLVSYLLSTANVMYPLLMFGVANTIIKFYSSYKTKQEKDSFLLLMLVLPLAVIIPVGTIGTLAYEEISNWISQKNTIAKQYTWTIYVVAVAMGYFEVFFSWGKIHLKSVFGTIMKEVFHRICTMVLLVAIYFNYLSVEQFIYAVTGVYLLRLLIIKMYAFSIYRPAFNFTKPKNIDSIIKYSILIVIAGTVTMFLFDLDKFMLGQFIAVENIAYYNVAVFIAFVIAVPARAMHQIVNPLTAKYLNARNYVELKDLYKKSALNLSIISGGVFILIVVNINQMYLILPPNYSQALYVVLLISIVKLFGSVIGNNNAILFNSDYYRIVLALGVFVVTLAIALNIVLIPKYGINGAAIATFISYISYDALKVLYVKQKMKMHPFTKELVYVLILILLFSVVFYNFELPFSPWVNIIVKSVLISSLYALVIIKLGFSETLTTLVNDFFKKNA